MGHYLIEYGRFAAIKGAGGYYILNPTTQAAIINSASQNSNIQECINLYKKRTNTYTDSEIVATMIRMKLGGRFIDESTLKTKTPEIYLYEKQLWKNILDNLKEIDVVFSLKSFSKSDVFDLLETFLCDGKICFEGSEIIRIFNQSIGNKIGTFFSGQKHGETLAMFSLADIRKIDVIKDNVQIVLKNSKIVSIYHHAAYQ